MSGGDLSPAQEVHSSTCLVLPWTSLWHMDSFWFWLTSLIWGYSGTSILELNPFWTTVREAICLKIESLLLPERHVMITQVLAWKGHWVENWHPKCCSTAEVFFSLIDLLENRLVREPRRSRTEVWLYLVDSLDGFRQNWLSGCIYLRLLTCDLSLQKSRSLPYGWSGSGIKRGAEGEEGI